MCLFHLNPFELQGYFLYFFRHLKGGKRLISKVDCNMLDVVANQNLRNLHWQRIIGLYFRGKDDLTPVSFGDSADQWDIQRSENVWKFSMLPNDTACSQKSQLLSLHFPIV